MFLCSFWHVNLRGCRCRYGLLAWYPWVYLCHCLPIFHKEHINKETSKTKTNKTNQNKPTGLSDPMPNFSVMAWTTCTKRLSDHFCMYNSVTSLSFWISYQGIITQCRLPILSILWGFFLSLSCCEGGYQKLVDFQVMKNGQISINIFGNIKVLPFLSKLHFESWKAIPTFLRNSHFNWWFWPF